MMLYLSMMDGSNLLFGYLVDHDGASHIIYSLCLKYLELVLMHEFLCHLK